MENIIYLIPVVLVVVVSVFVVRIATVALKMTGMEEKKAHFQALSAFTGTGFTTKDSEIIFQDDIRRKIVAVLMILGNAGLVTAITALIFSFNKGGGGIKPILLNSALLILMLLILYKIATHRRLTMILTKRIEARLEKRPLFEKRPVEEILRVAKDYGIAEVTMKGNCQNIGKTLKESSFRENDILVLAIQRKNNVIPAPKASDTIQLDDTLICYGKFDNLEKII